MATITFIGRLVVTSCWCGIALAIPEDLYDYARRKGTQVFCPIGHSFVYGDTEYKRLQREAKEAREAAEFERRRRASALAELDQANAEADHQRARVRGYQGALVKSKKRAAGGVCPVPGCKRSFANVARHVETVHPDFHPEAHEDPAS
jgi:hypothetical protein